MARQVERKPRMHTALGLIFTFAKAGCDGTSEVRGHLWLHQEFKASLRYMRPHLNNQTSNYVNKRSQRGVGRDSHSYSLLTRPLVRTRLDSMCETLQMASPGEIRDVTCDIIGYKLAWLEPKPSS